ncbi:MAG: hypothetical protein ABI877_23220 [Gemmatimonadaceae bacterium]
MKPLRFFVGAAVALVLCATTAHAQAATSITPRGTYVLVPDSSYAGPDIAGLVLTFAEDNTMVVAGPDGSLIVKSKLTFDNGVMTLNDQDGTNVCTNAGKYRVVGDLKTFKLTLVEDGCQERSAIITTVKFVRQA